MTGFRSEFFAAGKTIDDEEMISYITAGLDSFYTAMVDRVDNTPGISLDDVRNQINAFDMRQTLLSKINSDIDPLISLASLSSRSTMPLMVVPLFATVGLIGVVMMNGA
jgi:hypothetical protein